MFRVVLCVYMGFGVWARQNMDQCGYCLCVFLLLSTLDFVPKDKLPSLTSSTYFKCFIVMFDVSQKSAI